MVTTSTTTNFVRQPFLIGLYLVLTGLIYFNSLRNGFVFDDQHYVVNNYLIKALDGSALWGMFTSFYAWDYLPLTFLSLSVDYWLYGLNPLGYHLSNTLLHFINSLLAYQLVLKITKSSKGALWVSLLFLVHPIQVESVAWVSERKNLLSFLFFALSFIFYLRGGRRYLSLLFFLLAGLAKTSVVILPFLLVLHDLSFTQKQIKTILVEKVPYFIISIGVAMITLLSHSGGGTLRDHPDNNPINTIFSMMAVFKEYLTKILFPVNLNIWYPDQIYKSMLEPQVLISVAVIAGYLWLVRWSYAHKRIMFFGLVWFLIALLPVSHIIPFPQMMADRFLYIPVIGLLTALTAVTPGFNGGKVFLVVPVIAMLSFLSADRTQIFQDDFQLWQASVSKNPNNTRSMMYLGISHLQKGNTDRALELLQQARAIEPDNNKAVLYSAHIRADRKELKQAESMYRRLVEKSPDRPEYYTHLAVFLGNNNQVKESLGLLNKASKLDPGYTLAHFNRGVFLDKVGDSKGAFQAYQKAVGQEPQSAHYQYVLGMFYVNRTDHPEQGRKHLQKSLRLNPDQPLAVKINQTLKNLPSL